MPDFSLTHHYNGRPVKNFIIKVQSDKAGIHNALKTLFKHLRTTVLSSNFELTELYGVVTTFKEWIFVRYSIKDEFEHHYDKWLTD